MSLPPPASRLRHERREELRTRLANALILTTLTLSPVKIPLWRLDPKPPPAAVLPVGEPTPSLGFRG